MIITKDKIITLHYIMRNSRSEQLEAATKTFLYGSSTISETLQAQLAGLNPGDKKTITIPFAEAYGPEDPNMIIEFPKDRLPSDLTPEVGMQLTMNNADGQQFPVVITGVTDQNIVLNANHPLAGKDLVFDLELVEIED